MFIQSAYRQLSIAEKRFVDDYVNGLEAVAMRSGERISIVAQQPVPDAIVKQSNGLLERPLVISAIHERVLEAARASELTADLVVNEVRAIAMANLDDYMETDPISGFPVWNLSAASREQMAAIKKIECYESSQGGRSMKVEMHSKLEALKLLGQMLAIWQDDNAYIASIQRADNAAKALINKGNNAADAYAQLIGSAA